MRNAQQIAIIPLVVIFFSRRQARGFFNRNAYTCTGFGMREVVAFVGFEGDILRARDAVFRVVELVTVYMRCVLVIVIVIDGLVYFDSFAEVEHGQVNFRFIM